MEPLLADGLVEAINLSHWSSWINSSSFCFCFRFGKMALLKSEQSRIRSLQSRCGTCMKVFVFTYCWLLIWFESLKELIEVFLYFPYSTSFWFPDWYCCRLSQVLLCVQRRTTKLIPSSGPGLVLLALSSWWRALLHLSAGQRFPQQSHQWGTCRLTWGVLTVPALYTKNLETRVCHTGKEAKILLEYFRFKG